MLGKDVIRPALHNRKVQVVQGSSTIHAGLVSALLLLLDCVMLLTDQHDPGMSRRIIQI